METLQQTYRDPSRALRPRTGADAIRLRMGANADLTPAECDLLVKSGSMSGHLWARHSTIEPAVNGSAPAYIASGWAAHSRQDRQGRRQIIQLLLPGDPITPFPSADLRQEVICLTQVRLVDGEAIRSAGRNPDFSGIAAAIAKAASLDRAALIEQIVRLGRQTAHQRMASLLMELHKRCAAVGLAPNGKIAFPLTQEMLGDLLGLSVVHVNRTLQVLRRQGLVELKHGNLTLLSLDALTAIAAF